MFSSVAAAIAFASVVAAQSGLTINTPTSLVECQPSALTWVGGTGPYFLSVLPGGQPAATPLKNFDEQTGNSFTWTAVDIAANTPITIQVRDSTGTLAYTQAVTVQAGSSTTCLTAGGSSGASSAPASAGTGTTSAGSSTIAASGPAPSATVSATGSAGSSGSAAGTGRSSSGSAAAPSGSSGAAPSSSGADKVGAGIFTVAVAALFAAFA